MKRHTFKIFGFLTAVGMALEYVYNIWPARDGAQQFVQRVLLAGLAAAAVTACLLFLAAAASSARAPSGPGPRPSGPKPSA